MAVWPYGENGITNSLLEVFDADQEFFNLCIKKYTRWIYESQNSPKFKRTLNINFIIQQPGFGRRGFGEPDGLIKASQYAFYLEAKALSYSETFESDWRNFEKLNKYFAVASGIYGLVEDQQVITNDVVLLQDSGNHERDTRSFRIGDRPQILQDLYYQLVNNEYYIIIMTKDSLDEWPNIINHYSQSIQIIANEIDYPQHYDRRFGWMPLIDIYEMINDADSLEMQKLQRAFQCNGFV